MNWTGQNTVAHAQANTSNAIEGILVHTAAGATTAASGLQNLALRDPEESVETGPVLLCWHGRCGLGLFVLVETHLDCDRGAVFRQTERAKHSIDSSCLIVHNRHDMSLCEADQWHRERRRPPPLTQPPHFDHACFREMLHVYREKTLLHWMGVVFLTCVTSLLQTWSKSNVWLWQNHLWVWDWPNV